MLEQFRKSQREQALQIPLDKVHLGLARVLKILKWRNLQKGQRHSLEEPKSRKLICEISTFITVIRKRRANQDLKVLMLNLKETTSFLLKFKKKVL